MANKTTTVGVGWSKQTQDGRGLISLVITNPVGPDFKFTLWPVDPAQKRSERSPDFNVTKQADDAPAYQPQGQGQDKAAAPASRRGVSHIPPGADSASEAGPSDGDDAPWEG
jgi:uncharacterized protein (DUF736 family)